MSDTPKTPAWVGITYLLYCFMIWGTCIGGTGYVVFVLGNSGWWFCLGIALGSCGFSPSRWHSIWSGVEQ